MARDLFLGALDAVPGEIIDQELVAPPAAASRVGGPGGIPVLMKACIDDQSRSLEDASAAPTLNKDFLNIL